jgi:quinol monooxygenase YgiN
LTAANRIPSDGAGQTNDAVRVLATILMRISPKKRKEALGIIASMIERIRLEEGCLSCRLFQEVIKGKNLMLQELWANETSFQRHLRSDEFRHVLLVVEMANAPPEIRFDRIAHSSDIASIAAESGYSQLYTDEDPSPHGNQGASS